MALRGTKLIFPNFIGSKSGLANSVNPDLEVGETIHEKDTNRYKTNLTAETASWNSLPYGAQFISFPSASELKTYLSGSGDQVIFVEEYGKVYTNTSIPSSSTLQEPDYIIDNNSTVYKSVTQGFGFPFEGDAVITGSLTVQGRILDSQSLAFWGAVGDGVTDDTVAIQTALNSNTASAQVKSNEVENLTGGTVIYGEPGKTYLIGDTLTVPTNVRFDLNQSRIYVTGSHDAVRLKPWSRLENGTILISESLDYTDKSAILLLAKQEDADTPADVYFPSIRRLYETTAGIRNMNLRGPGIIPAGGITGSVEAKLTGNAILLKAEATSFDVGPNINATKFNDFEIVGFGYGIHIASINPVGVGAQPYISNNQFSNFGLKNNAYGIYIYNSQTPDTQISESAGFPSNQKAGALASSNVFTDFWFNPVKTTYGTNNAIVNYGEKNLFDNFFIIDYKNAFTGSVADGGSPFKASSPQFFSPSNGNRLNDSALNSNDFVPAAIVDLNPQGGNVYNGEFTPTHVQDRSYTGFNKYNSTRFDEFYMVSPIDHGVTLPPYHSKGLPVGDQNDYLAYAYERGFGISQSRYPDSVTGSRYDDISQGISTVFEPYGNGFVRYNSVTSSVEITLSFPQEEFNSYIREFSKLSLSDYYNRSDNRFFKGLGVRFKEQKDFTTSSVDDYYQTPEHVKISVIQRNRLGNNPTVYPIYEYNDNKTLFLGNVGKKAFEAGTNGGFWDVKVMFSSSTAQDNPVALERISCWLGTDDNKAYIKRSDDYYYGGLEFKPVYGRNADGTVDRSNVIREASLTVSGSSLITEDLTVEGRILDSQSLAFWGAVGDGVTDDTIAIQTALNSNTASADVRYDQITDLTGGTVVYSEPGKTYLIGDTIIVPTNVKWDLNQSRIYVTSSHDAVRLKPGSRIENGTILISSSLDYTDKAAILMIASASADVPDDEFFPNIRRVYETTAGISKMNLRGPAITEGVTGPVEAKNTGNAILLKAESNQYALGPNIVGSKCDNFDIIGFKYGIHCQAINPGITGSTPFINSTQFSDFGIKHTTYGIYLETNQTPGTEISGSAGFSSGDRVSAVVNQNIFTNFWFQPVVATYSTNNAIVNYGEKNIFDNFTIWDYQYTFTGSVADGGSPFLEATPKFYTPNGNQLNTSNLDGTSTAAAAIVDYNPNGGNVYNGGFQLHNVLDRSYSGGNEYNSTSATDFAMLSPMDNLLALPPYHSKGLPIGDQNDYLAYAYERGFGISQSRYPDSATGSRYDNISQSISTVFEPYENGFVRYNSVTESVELTISFPQEEFNSYIREFERLGQNPYYTRSDNRLFKGLGVRFKEQEDNNLDNFYQTPEYVKISAIQRNRSGGFVAKNTIYEYNDNKALFLGGVGKQIYRSTANGGYWDVEVIFSSSADQDNPVALERISCWLGGDDNKAYIKRSDDYYYGGLEFKPVYGRNTDGTVDTATTIRSASLHVSGSISMDDFVLTSPNGTQYRFTTTDDGYLSITGSAV